MVTSVTQTDAYTPDGFQSGSDALETTEVTVKTGQNLAAREVIAIETATGQAVTYNHAGAGGAEVAVYVTAYAVDATGGATKAQVYKAGTFDAAALTWSSTPSDAVKAGAFAGTPISLQDLQA